MPARMLANASSCFPWRIWTADKVFITSGYGTGCALLKVSLSGAEVLWTNDVMASHHSDPFIIDGHIYG